MYVYPRGSVGVTYTEDHLAMLVLLGGEDLSVLLDEFLELRFDGFLGQVCFIQIKTVHLVSFSWG